jgi:predicted O-methyltransferase YrrM
MLRALRNYLAGPGPLRLAWLRRDGWLGEHLTELIPGAPRKRKIERTARKMDAVGPQPLAEIYGETDGFRLPGDVRSSARIGDLYAWLVQRRKPRVVVEFGSAFGVSGMYFMSGLERNGSGHLYTFEVNPIWADIAEASIRSVGDRFTLTRGAFEEHVATTVTNPIDIAFVDAIHDYTFIHSQFEILRPRMRPGGIVMFDDIDFRKPGCRMMEGWREIAARADVDSAVEINGHLGIIEMNASVPT